MTMLAYLWAARRGYRRDRYEIEARAIAARIRSEVCGGQHLAPAAGLVA